MFSKATKVRHCKHQANLRQAVVWWQLQWKDVETLSCYLTKIIPARDPKQCGGVGDNVYMIMWMVKRMMIRMMTMMMMMRRRRMRMRMRMMMMRMMMMMMMSMIMRKMKWSMIRWKRWCREGGRWWCWEGKWWWWWWWRWWRWCWSWSDDDDDDDEDAPWSRTCL